MLGDFRHARFDMEENGDRFESIDFTKHLHENTTPVVFWFYQAQLGDRRSASIESDITVYLRY